MSEEINNEVMRRAEVVLQELAEFYEKLHEKYFTDYNIECITGFGETLTKIFPNNYEF